MVFVAVIFLSFKMMAKRINKSDFSIKNFVFLLKNYRNGTKEDKYGIHSLYSNYNSAVYHIQSCSILFDLLLCLLPNFQLIHHRIYTCHRERVYGFQLDITLLTHHYLIQYNALCFLGVLLLVYPTTLVFLRLTYTRNSYLAKFKAFFFKFSHFCTVFGPCGLLQSGEHRAL